MITKEEIKQAISDLEMENASVCIHSSLRSFGQPLEQGPATIVDAFLEKDCTIMVPTFSYGFLVKPPKELEIEQNGCGDYTFLEGYPHEKEIYSAESQVISKEDMGSLPAYIVKETNRVRGNHPLNSFSAVGKDAHALIDAQTWAKVYAPFEKMYHDENSYILLMGVSLSEATILHYAEEMSGRNLFIRWAYDAQGKIGCMTSGGCSEGFENAFHRLAEPIAKTAVVGNSLWQCYKAKELVEICAKAIKENPMITHCGDNECGRCNDAVKGGPVIKLS